MHKILRERNAFKATQESKPGAASIVYQTLLEKENNFVKTNLTGGDFNTDLGDDDGRMDAALAIVSLGNAGWEACDKRRSILMHDDGYMTKGSSNATSPSTSSATDGDLEDVQMYPIPGTGQNQGERNVAQRAEVVHVDSSRRPPSNRPRRPPVRFLDDEPDGEKREKKSSPSSLSPLQEAEKFDFHAGQVVASEASVQQNKSITPVTTLQPSEAPVITARKLDFLPQISSTPNQTMATISTAFGEVSSSRDRAEPTPVIEVRKGSLQAVFGPLDKSDEEKHGDDREEICYQNPKDLVGKIVNLKKQQTIAGKKKSRIPTKISRPQPVKIKVQPNSVVEDNKSTGDTLNHHLVHMFSEPEPKANKIEVKSQSPKSNIIAPKQTTTFKDIAIVYHKNMARHYPGSETRTPEQAEQRRKNTVAARVSRAKAKFMALKSEEERAKYFKEVVILRRVVAAYSVYANLMRILMNSAQTDWLAKFSKECDVNGDDYDEEDGEFYWCGAKQGFELELEDNDLLVIDENGAVTVNIEHLFDEDGNIQLKTTASKRKTKSSTKATAIKKQKLERISNIGGKATNDMQIEDTLKDTIGEEHSNPDSSQEEQQYEDEDSDSSLLVIATDNEQDDNEHDD